jgi:hypothetical protein
MDSKQTPKFHQKPQQHLSKISSFNSSHSSGKSLSEDLREQQAQLEKMDQHL